MSHLENLKLPQSANVSFAVRDATTLTIAGSITIRDPGAEFGPVIRAIHQAALEDQVKELVVDLTRLVFVNSSTLRLFVDWTSWVRTETPARQYKLKFLSSRQLAWQRTSLTALMSLAKNVISFETVD